MKRLILSIAVLALSTGIAFTQETASLRKKHFNLGKSGLALDGYDPVGYFKSNKATPGKKEFAVNHQGVVYYFSSAENRDSFIKYPSGYEPEYGGWCAYAMGKNGEKVDIDPETFKVINGKLYLFYNRFFNNTLTSWNKDEARLKANAEINWKKTFHL